MNSDKNFNQSEKIFIDSDEDIIFIAEKIRDAEKDKILLFVPEHAILLSSLVNLKLLARILVETRKNVILITTNELALNKSVEANLIAFPQVSDVNESTWEEAESRLEELRSERENVRSKLLNSRKESMTVLETDQKQEAIQEERSLESKNEEEIKSVLERKRLDHKLQILGPFEILGGGNINEVDIEPLKRNLRLDLNKRVISEEIPESIDSDNNAHDLEEKKFINKDFGDVKSRFRNRQSNSSHAQISDFAGKHRNQESSILSGMGKYFGKSTGKYIGIGALLILALIGSGKMFFENVTVDLSVKAESVDLKETITASSDVTVIDTVNKRIPLRKISEVQGGSDTVETKNEEERGTKAQGVVDFYNRTPDTITLNKGTRITTLSGGNLVFLLNETVKVPPRISERIYSHYENAQIIAEGYGEKFNVSSVDVKIEGYDTINQLSGRIFREVRGGTSKQVKVVTQEEIDALKTRLSDSIKETLRNNLKGQIEQGDVEIPGSETLKETKFELSAKAGDEAQTFDIINLEYEMSILTIKQSELDLMADAIIMKNNGIDDKDLIKSSSKAVISNIRRLDNGEVKFDLQKQSKVPSSIDENLIIKEIGGKDLTTAEALLNDHDEIQEFEINYSPFYMPSFFRSVPTSKDRIKVNTTSDL